MTTNDLLKTALENLPKSKGWKPEEGEEYWVVSGDGYIRKWDWEDDSEDNKFLGNNNCFRTKSDAKKASQVICEVLKLIRKELYN